MKTKTYLAFLLAALLAGCSDHDHDKPKGHVHGPDCAHGATAEKKHEHDPDCAHGEATEKEGDGYEHGEDCDHDDHGDVRSLSVSKEAQRLIGLTLVKVENRAVHSTVRFPGRFEMKPDARRIYGAVLDGAVEIHVRPHQRVAAGDVLFRITSPAWVQQSGQLRDAESALTLAAAEVQILSERLERLTAAGTKNAELGMTLKLKAAEQAHAERTLKSVSEMRQAVLAHCRAEEGALVVVAREPGVVEQIAVDSGAWVAQGAEIVSVVREDGVWFRADGLVSELSQIRDGLRGFVTPMRSASEKAEGTLTVAWAADADTRTRPLYLTPDAPPAWATPGTPGLLDIILNAPDENTLAVPVSCIVEDGLARFVFVRDDHDADTFLYEEVTLGASDGDWVEVTGIHPHDWVVLHGVYQLKQALPPVDGAAKPKAAGHFHADGVYHEGTHE
jgi:multidrug efflux pump subunit AcrA (membrane-fusion protein)